MFETIAFSMLIFSGWKRGTTEGSIFSILGLGICLYALRWTNGDAMPLILGTLAVFLFWFAQSIRLSLSSIRTLMILIVGLGFAVYLLQDSLPFLAPQAFNSVEISPSSIASMKSSHQKALELYFDHTPNTDERYFKTGVLATTDNGLDYRLGGRAPLATANFPKAAEYSKEVLKGDFDQNIEQLRQTWASDFRYSLEPGAMPGPHPLDSFLFDKKVGFCQHFAASLTTLLKLKGYNAHVAVGFSGGSWNPIFHKLSYEMSDAHAWVEVFNSQSAHWSRIDPTLWVSPALNPPRTDYTLIKWMSAFLIVGTLLSFFFAGRSADAKRSLLKELSRLEARNEFSDKGLTVTERLERLAKAYPQKQALFSEIAKHYQQLFFEAHASITERALLSQIRKMKWVRR